MTDERKVPELRFEGFEDEWEQRKLSEVAKNTYGGGTPRTSVENFWKGTIPWIQSQDIIEGQVFDVCPRKFISAEAVSKSATKLVSKNSIAIVTRVGVGKLAYMPYAYCTSQDFLSLGDIVIDDKYATYAIYKMLQKEKQNVQGTSIKGITIEEVLSKQIDVPRDENEQYEIGIYFSNIDRLITLHQRKHDKLVLLKKSMLEKMFPQKGSKVPEVRFAGFTDDWEQRKLSELGKIITGSTPSTQHSEYYSDNGIPWVTPTDISDNITFETARKLSKEGEKVARIVPPNAILVTCIASIGKNTMLGITGSFNQQINALVPNQEKYNPYFLFTESSFWSKEMQSIAAQGTMQIINKTEFSSLTTYTPTLDEQQKIGVCFATLDRLITLHQRKLEKLKQIKKSMLQKMFV